MSHERRMNMKNDDKLKEQMNSEPVPDRLRPENIKIMLDNEAPKKKRKGIAVSRITAAAAACAVIGGTAAYNWNNGKINKSSDNSLIEPTTKQDVRTPEAKPAEPETKKFSYMSGAESYEQIYNMFEEANKKAKKAAAKTYGAMTKSNFAVEEAMPDSADEEVDVPKTNGGEYSSNAGLGGSGEIEPEVPVISTSDDEKTTEPVTEPATEPTTEAETEPTTEAEKDPEHSDTYYQEQDVLEADIVKTDGKHIYYLGNDMKGKYNSPVLRVANVKDGKFTSQSSVDLKSDINKNAEEYTITVNDMYIYNDMIAIIGTDYTSIYSYSNGDFCGSCNGSTFVAFYTTGDQPELIDVYTQDGSYDDVRISPDGYMLLLSDYTSYSFDNIENSGNENRYIPSYGCRDDVKLIPAEDILLPADDVNGFCENGYNLPYTVIGSIDLNESGAPKSYDIKSLAGYTGSIYCSADNLYSASYSWNDDNTTEITRISIKDGDIVPMAGGTVQGSIKDQFSMSEYDGYFRVAATYTETEKVFHKYSDDYDYGFFEGIWNSIVSDDDEEGYYTYNTIKTDTRVYVLDMDMNIVGSVGELGVGEQLKSASFSGNMAYVVTFRQTDPLYAVDLSNPQNPVVLDEFKINGFSTYMQPWGDGLLLGFGQDADDNGRISGLRLTMFDNSDPNNLKAADVFTWNSQYFLEDDIRNQSESYYSSEATYQRKALLIAPEKNLIGVPINKETYSYDNDYNAEYSAVYQYVFFRFEDGKFVEIGDISTPVNGWDDYNTISRYNRALYIGDYVYTLSSNKFIAAEISTLEITDELVF